MLQAGAAGSEGFLNCLFYRLVRTSGRRSLPMTRPRETRHRKGISSGTPVEGAQSRQQYTAILELDPTLKVLSQPQQLPLPWRIVVPSVSYKYLPLFQGL